MGKHYARSKRNMGKASGVPLAEIKAPKKRSRRYRGPSLPMAGASKRRKRRGPPTALDHIAEPNKEGSVWIIRPRYEILSIDEAKIMEDGELCVLVRWRGRKRRSWEPFHTIAEDAPELMAEFRERFK